MKYTPCFSNESRVTLFHQICQHKDGPFKGIPCPAQMKRSQHSLEDAVEPLPQGDRAESETAEKCEHKREGEVVNPIFDRTWEWTKLNGYGLR